MKKNKYPHPFRPEELPTGKFYGALPDVIMIDGVHWECIKTGDVDGITYDKIRSTATGEVKTVKRDTLINFLHSKLK